MISLNWTTICYIKHFCVRESFQWMCVVQKSTCSSIIINIAKVYIVFKIHALTCEFSGLVSPYCKRWQLIFKFEQKLKLIVIVSNMSKGRRIISLNFLMVFREYFIKIIKNFLKTPKKRRRSTDKLWKIILANNQWIVLYYKPIDYHLSFMFKRSVYFGLIFK